MSLEKVKQFLSRVREARRPRSERRAQKGQSQQQAGRSDATKQRLAESTRPKDPAKRPPGQEKTNQPAKTQAPTKAPSADKSNEQQLRQSATEKAKVAKFLKTPEGRKAFADLQNIHQQVQQAEKNGPPKEHTKPPERTSGGSAAHRCLPTEQGKPGPFRNPAAGQFQDQGNSASQKAFTQPQFTGPVPKAQESTAAEKAKINKVLQSSEGRQILSQLQNGQKPLEKARPSPQPTRAEQSRQNFEQQQTRQVHHTKDKGRSR